MTTLTNNHKEHHKENNPKTTKKSQKHRKTLLFLFDFLLQKKQKTQTKPPTPPHPAFTMDLDHRKGLRDPSVRHEERAAVEVTNLTLEAQECFAQREGHFLG